MPPHFLLAPLPHGALGYWDELINLIPLVVGVILLVVLYRASRRRAAEADEPEPDPADHVVPPRA
jgi:hypothetical protein